MATTDLPVFPQNPKIATAITTAVDDLTSTLGTKQLLVTAGANGAEVSSITAIPRATITAAGLYLFVNKSADSLTLFENSALMAAHTIAATTAVPVTDFGFTESNTLLLDAGDKLYVGSAVALAGGIVFTGQWVDL